MAQMMELLQDAGNGNPGALSVCCAMIEYLFKKLITQGIVGAEVWLLFKDCNNQDLTQFLTCLIDGSAITKLQSCPYSRFYLNDKEEYATVC